MTNQNQRPKIDKSKMFKLGKPKVDWHWHRWDLAKQILESMQAGQRSALALFALRRKGKTDFLRKDIAPLAEDMGAAVVYIDFWGDDKNPGNAFRIGVEDAARRYTDSGALTLKEVTIGIPKALSVTFESQDSTQSPNLLKLCFDKLREFDRPIVLLLDEIQQLAIDPNNESFIRALRSNLQQTTHWINTVYTGSSQNLLAEMFKNSNAALYQAAEMKQLNSLGHDFISHVLTVFKDNSGLSIDLSEAAEVFENCGRRPRVLIDLLNILWDMSASGDENQVSLRDAFSIHRKTLLEVGGSILVDAWGKLSPFDKAVLKILATQTNHGIFSQHTLSLISDLGVTKPRINVNNVQASVTRLNKKNIVFSTSRGAWLFADSLDKAWVIDLKISTPERVMLGLPTQASDSLVPFFDEPDQGE